ncbi:MAG: hypothetical protein H7202_07460 [Pedobacter sp.]|nr:hypothetical protein [Pedobacter sp.]
MEKVNHKRIITITSLKVLFAVIVFFTINNWVHIKQSFGGDVPALSAWLNHAFTPSNLILLPVLGVVFYMNTLKHHRELAKKRSKYTEM